MGVFEVGGEEAVEEEDGCGLVGVEGEVVGGRVMERGFFFFFWGLLLCWLWWW